MKKFLLVLILFAGYSSFAQNFTGQWKGSFIDKSTAGIGWGGDRCDYVIDLDVQNNKATGFSYTYFTQGGKKYYTICRLEGYADKKRKYIEVRETERTKTNVPDEIINSFQIHKLFWRKSGADEVLEGNWVPAPGQQNNGFGTTLLTKRQLREIAPNAKINAPQAQTAFVTARPAPAPKRNLPTVRANPPAVKQPAPTVKIPEKPTVKAKIITPAKPVIKVPVETAKKDTSKTNTEIAIAGIKGNVTPLPAEFDKRASSILQTVSVENSTVHIELYDNGEIDGDSVSVIYNSEVLLLHKRLSDKPLSLDIPVKEDAVNELIMYADNLGTIPPNTALMVVRDGNKRYEVRITSDLKKSGTIRFIHRTDQ